MRGIFRIKKWGLLESERVDSLDDINNEKHFTTSENVNGLTDRMRSTSNSNNDYDSFSFVVVQTDVETDERKFCILKVMESTLLAASSVAFVTVILIKVNRKYERICCFLNTIRFTKPVLIKSLGRF